MGKFSVQGREFGQGAHLALPPDAPPAARSVPAGRYKNAPALQQSADAEVGAGA